MTDSGQNLRKLFFRERNQGKMIKVTEFKGRLVRGRRRGSPELPVPRRRVTGEGQSGALGLGLGLGLAGEVDRGMRNPLGWISRCCGGAKQGAWRGGGSAWRSIAGDGG